MSLMYEIAPREVQIECDSVMRNYHHALVELDVKVRCVFAFQDDDSAKPCVKVGGVPCYAAVQKTPTFYRALGVPDAVITLDKKRYMQMSDQRKQALLDHELSHLQVDDSADAAGRPKMKIIHHDWELHGFYGVVERWGLDAIELSQIREFKDLPESQQVFDFLSTPEKGQELVDELANGKGRLVEISITDKASGKEVSVSGGSVADAGRKLRLVSGG